VNKYQKKEIVMKITTMSYGQFLVNSQVNFTGTYFAETVAGLDHNSVFRFLKYEKLTPKLVREKVSPDLVTHPHGVIIFDDTVVDKSFSRVLPLATKQYSGNAHHVVNGIGVVNCLYYHPELKEFWILDYRLYDPATDGQTKLDHVRDMLDQLTFRHIPYQTVLMDSWYATIPLMRQIHDLGKIYYCPLKSNRQVDDSQATRPYQAVSSLAWTQEELDHGKRVHLKGLSEPAQVQLFRVPVSTDRTDYIVTNDVTQAATTDTQEVCAIRWTIEQFHRELKQLTGIEDCQARLARSQRNHICMSILAWIVLKRAAKKNHVTIYEQKRSAIKNYFRDLWQNPSTVFA
jgi:hypothetical protein